MPTTLTFLNQPKISEHAADDKFNARKIVLVPLIEELLSKHILFRDAHVEVSFVHEGISSLVAILVVKKMDDAGEHTKEQKYVIKIPLSILDARLEATFLNTWESAGVRVPHVFDEGAIGEHSYSIMEYVDAQKLNDTYSRPERTEKRIYVEIGALLRKMHEPKAKGYSNVVNSNPEPEYTKIADWLAGDTRSQDQITFAKANGLFDAEDSDLIDRALNVIATTIGDSDETVYCHNDLHFGNIFDTQPMTVFDPWPCFHHPYMDLSRTILMSINHGFYENADQLIEGYFGSQVPDRQLLQAFIIINSCLKYKFKFDRNKEEGIFHDREYMRLTKHYL